MEYGRCGGISNRRRPTADRVELPGEFVSARLVQAPGARDDRDYARFIRLAGVDWALASMDDPPEPGPALPR